MATNLLTWGDDTLCWGNDTLSWGPVAPPVAPTFSPTRPTPMEVVRSVADRQGILNWPVIFRGQKGESGITLSRVGDFTLRGSDTAPQQQSEMIQVVFRADNWTECDRLRSRFMDEMSKESRLMDYDGGNDIFDDGDESYVYSALFRVRS